MIYKGENWETKSSIRVGKRGTAKVYDEFGDKLICIRYRYNGKGMRIKTAEIIIDVAKIASRLPPNKDKKEIRQIINQISRTVADLCTCKSLSLIGEGHAKDCPAKMYLRRVNGREE